MNVTELGQVVFPPEDQSDELVARIEALIENDPEPIIPNIKLAIGRLFHPLGIHSWVRWREYDRASDRIIDLNGRVCAWCPKGLLR